MTEGISQEARDAGSKLLVDLGHEGDGEPQDCRDGDHDGSALVQAMQSLINSTLERAAVVAEGRADQCGDTSIGRARNGTAEDIATAIRQMKGTTNV